MSTPEQSCYPFRITPSDVDFTRCASLSAFLSYVLAVAGLDAASKGFGLQILKEKDCTWVLSRVAIEFSRLPRLEERIDVYTWVNDWGRVFTTRNFHVYDEQGELIATVVTQWCMLNLETRKLVNLTGDYDAILDKRPSPIAKARKINTSDLPCVAEHQVVYSDIDFNRHVNTMRYIEMMLDAMPLNIVQSMGGTRVDVHFASECKYGEKLQVKYKQDGANALFEIAHEDGSAAVKAAFGTIV